MTNQPIKGYRQISEDEIALINEIKTMGNQVGELLERLACQTEYPTDGQWFHIAKTDLQKGFMALVRSVAKPEGF